MTVSRAPRAGPLPRPNQLYRLQRRGRQEPGFCGGFYPDITFVPDSKHEAQG